MITPILETYNLRHGLGMLLVQGHAGYQVESVFESRQSDSGFSIMLCYHAMSWEREMIHLHKATYFFLDTSCTFWSTSLLPHLKMLIAYFPHLCLLRSYCSSKAQEDHFVLESRYHPSPIGIKLLTLEKFHSLNSSLSHVVTCSSFIGILCTFLHVIDP